MSIHVYTAEQLRPRIIRAIKNGNNERKGIKEVAYVAKNGSTGTDTGDSGNGDQGLGGLEG